MTDNKLFMSWRELSLVVQKAYTKEQGSLTQEPTPCFASKQYIQNGTMESSTFDNT